MSDPKRWSSAGSEVDPVLRSVLLYGRDLQPDSRQLQAIIRGSGQRRASPQRRRFIAFLTAAAAAACAGIAWAGYASGLFFSSTATTPSPNAPASQASAPAGGSGFFGRKPPPAARVSSPPHVETPPVADPAAPSVVPGAVDAPGALLRPEPVAVASSTVPRPNASTSSAPSAATSGTVPRPNASTSSVPSAATSGTVPRPNASTSSAPPSAAPDQDAALLQQARFLVTSEPARALALTRDHELRFPSSPLSEERQALRIEALARLGRQTEAARALSTFDQTFPRSLYRHRLHTLLSN